MQTFNEYVIEEGKFSKIAAMGALAASSAFGNFVQDWSKHYQTSQDPAKEARVTAVLKQGFKVPQDAMKSIKVASYIFDGDDSSAYFGPKFKKTFGENALKQLQGLNEQQMSDLLLKNDDLAATMAAAVWIRSSW